MGKIEEIQIYCQNIDRSTLLDMTSRILLRDCKYLLFHISTLEKRVKKLEEAIEKHKKDMWGYGEDEKGEMYQVGNCIDEELYKARDKICGE